MAADPRPQEPSEAGRRLVFIGGLHRSGTTPLARWMGLHPDISAFADTGVYHDEGQHLQDLYPTARRFGGPGKFALVPESGLTEDSPLATEEGRRNLWTAWAPHWELERKVLLEKSPPNLVRMRFLQALFPGACFIVVTRHPLAVAYATRKWVRASLPSLLRHWQVGHQRCLQDAPYVERLAFVRYEDLIADPTAQLAAAFRFVGLPPHAADWEVKPSLNEAYLRRWKRARFNPVKRLLKRRIRREFDDPFGAWGYSLSAPEIVGRARAPVADYLLAPPA